MTSWILYLGGERPLNNSRGQEDSAQSLIYSAINAGFAPCLVLLHSSDHLIPWLDQQGIAWMPLPDILVGKRLEIAQALEEPQTQALLQPVCTLLQELQPQWGLSFYSPWIPPQIFSLPQQAFLNFHPGNLPELRGFEPDSWAILRAMQSIQGCVHRLTLIYDAGDLAWKTSPTSICPWDTPTSLIERVTRIFVEELPDLLKAMQKNSLVFTPQLNPPLQAATRAQLIAESFVDWQLDSHQQLSRRLRVFNGQNIGIPLQARIEGRCYRLLSMELWRGPCLGDPGRLLGRYQDSSSFFDQSPIIATRDGLALVKMNELEPVFCPLTPEQLQPCTPLQPQACFQALAASLKVSNLKVFNARHAYEYDPYGSDICSGSGTSQTQA